MYNKHYLLILYTHYLQMRKVKRFKWNQQSCVHRADI